MITTWRKRLTKLFKTTGDSFDELYIDITDEQLDRVFDDEFGTSTAPGFQAWGKKYVYCSEEYDGSDGIIALPRKPPDDLERYHGTV